MAHSPKPKPHPARPQWTRTNLRAWREDRGRTLESLAEPMGITHSQLSKIERGLYPYNQNVLEVAARELKCSVQDLLTRLPNEGQNVFSVWPKLDPRQKKQLDKVAESFVDESP